ncbi:astacin [Ostertagia ostertagi]
MRILIITILVATCVSAGWIGSEKPMQGLKSLVKEQVTKNLKNFMDRMKEMFKRKTVDKVLPLGDSIEEINTNSGVADILFQGDMVLSKQQQDQIAADISDIRSKRQAINAYVYTGSRWRNRTVSYFFDDKTSDEVKSVFKKAAQLWTDNTCVDIKENENAEDRIRVLAQPGCWSHVGRQGREQQISLGQTCESVWVRKVSLQETVF